jgi:hypothetical protein
VFVGWQALGSVENVHADIEGLEQGAVDVNAQSHQELCRNDVEYLILTFALPVDRVHFGASVHHLVHIVHEVLRLTIELLYDVLAHLEERHEAALEPVLPVGAEQLVVLGHLDRNGDTGHHFLHALEDEGTLDLAGRGPGQHCHHGCHKQLDVGRAVHQKHVVLELLPFGQLPGRA